LEDADLAEVERYFPDVAHYGVWWVKRYLLEHEGGIVANHSILTSSASEIPRLAARLVAQVESESIEKNRKALADSERKKASQ
jgi:hypothetical protein